MRVIILFCFSLFFTSTSIAQDASFRKANRLFDDLAYAEAIPLYEKSLEKEFRILEALRLAECFRLNEDFQNAELWYARVAADGDAGAEAIYEFALSLLSNGKPEEARHWFAQYAGMRPGDERVAAFIRDIDRPERLYDAADLFQLRNLELNTEVSEFGPFLIDGGMLFTSEPVEQRGTVHSWTKHGFYDLYFSPRELGDFENRKSYARGSLNRAMHDGPACLSSDQDELFFTRNNMMGKKPLRDDQGNSRLAIFYTKKLEEEWSLAEKLSFNMDEYSSAHPSISADGKLLFFSSDRPGGYGKSDIWVVERVGNTWGEPQNLGPQINTAGEEAFPFVHEDGTLYFSSDAWGGLGAMDIFRSTRDQNGIWKNVTNLGFPINSRKDDFGIFWDRWHRIGYFASNREGGKGSDDIYEVRSRGFHLSALVYDVKTGDPIGEAEVELVENQYAIARDQSDEQGQFRFRIKNDIKYKLRIDAEGYPEDVTELLFKGIKAPDSAYVEIPLSRNGIVSSEKGFNVVAQILDRENLGPVPGADVTVKNTCGDEHITLRSDMAGYISFMIKPACNYILEARKQAYMPDVTQLSPGSIKDPSLVAATLYMNRLSEGLTVEMKHLYYDYDEDYVREDGVEDLMNLLDLLQRYEEMRVAIGSHTDARGNDQYNLELSQRRANSVVSWLVDQGINANRLEAYGYGESQIRNACGNGIDCSEESHQYNRRTEFTILNLGSTSYSRDKLYIPVNTGRPASK